MPNNTILVIEDDLDIGKNLSEFLESEGYQVEVSTNGQVALEYLRSSTPNPCLILLDLMMPTMDGFQFRIEQEKDPKIATIPIVIMTASDHIEAKKIKVGAQDFIKKPLDINNLLNVVQRYC